MDLLLILFAKPTSGTGVCGPVLMSIVSLQNWGSSADAVWPLPEEDKKTLKQVAPWRWIDTVRFAFFVKTISMWLWKHNMIIVAKSISGIDFTGCLRRETLDWLTIICCTQVIEKFQSAGPGDCTPTWHAFSNQTFRRGSRGQDPELRSETLDSWTHFHRLIHEISLQHTQKTT